jgi:nitrite reductase/ring-hydroxylating ferredoxin subunit
MVLVGDDALVRRGMERLAAERDADLVAVGRGGPDAVANGRTRPEVIVVDACQPPETISAWHDRFPDALVVGFLAVPDRKRWTVAERAGCDVVVNRGAAVAQARSRLRAPGLRRLPLVDSADVAGRLGLVARIEDSPAGPLALYRVGSSLVAVDDLCPHAGAQLSAGTLDGVVLTCPRHGSQFDVSTGERVRGPADAGIRVHRVVEEAGRAWLVL